MSNLSSIYFLFFSIFFLMSCGQEKSLKNPVYNTTIFRGQQGEKEVNAFNKNKA